MISTLRGPSESSSICAQQPQWTAVTGEVPPPTTVDRDAYVQAGLPWFDYYHDYYDADAKDLLASSIPSGVQTVVAKLGG